MFEPACVAPLASQLDCLRSMVLTGAERTVAGEERRRRARTAGRVLRVMLSILMLWCSIV